MVDEGQRDEWQCSQGRAVILDGKDVFRLNYIEGVDGVDWSGVEEANEIEEVAD